MITFEDNATLGETPYTRIQRTQYVHTMQENLLTPGQLVRVVLVKIDTKVC